MKKLKIALFSLMIGFLLSVPAVAVLAACAETIVYDGKTCVLTGSNCGGNVCVCSYNCGPALQQDDH